MTRINVIPVSDLTDQHLMAEYRELPMVHAAARRSNPSKYVSSTKYTLNKGHVMFFYNKKKFLLNRWFELIEELYKRGYDIDPTSRVVDWTTLDKFEQIDWTPDEHAISINLERIQERIAQKPDWYRKNKTPLK
jgi:deoxyribonuclease (pyrimidine dimer)